MISDPKNECKACQHIATGPGNGCGYQHTCQPQKKKKSCGHYPCKGVCNGKECIDELGYTIICDQQKDKYSFITGEGLSREDFMLDDFD